VVADKGDLGKRVLGGGERGLGWGGERRAGRRGRDRGRGGAGFGRSGGGDARDRFVDGAHFRQSCGVEHGPGGLAGGAVVGAGLVLLDAAFEQGVALGGAEGADVGVERGVGEGGAAGGGGGAEERLELLDLLEAEGDGVEAADQRGLVVGLLGLSGEGGGEGGGEGVALTLPRAACVGPALSRLRERGWGAGEAGGGGVEPGLAVAAAVGLAGVHAEAEHQQAVVHLAPVADELAEAHDRHEVALERAFEGEVTQALDAEIERGFPGSAEAFGAGLAAEIISAFGGHVDHLRGALDRAGVGERGDEGALACRGPAVVAILALDGLEVGQRLARIGGVGTTLDHRRGRRSAGAASCGLMQRMAVGKGSGGSSRGREGGAQRRAWA